MSASLYWLTLTVIFSLIIWVPYVLNRIFVRGLFRSLGNPSMDDAPHSPWAERAMNAHGNMIENLAPFATVVLIAEITQKSDDFIATCAAIFLVSRIAHYIIYILGVPVLRTLAFAIGLAATLAIALRLLLII